MTQDERENQLESLQHSKEKAEKAFDRMYEMLTCYDAAWLYEIATGYLREALQLAEKLGLADEIGTVNARLEHMKTAYHSHFRRPPESLD